MYLKKKYVSINKVSSDYNRLIEHLIINRTLIYIYINIFLLLYIHMYVYIYNIN